MRTIIAMSAGLFILTGSAAAQDTVQVKTGWNIIGSVMAGVVPEVLSTIPDSLIQTSFFGYDPGVGYSSTDTLERGFGYWIKVKADGLIVFNTTNGPDSLLCGNKTVVHEGAIYRTVKIGSQCWLDRNMNVGTMVQSSVDQTDNAVLEKYCPLNESSNCAAYGGLYQWSEAMQYGSSASPQGVCPPGWHVPTLAEFQTLANNVGDDANALKGLRQGTGAGIGTNASGFSAMLAGYRHSDNFFYNFTENALFWSSTEFDATEAYFVYLVQGTNVISESNYTKPEGFSVRCLED